MPSAQSKNGIICVYICFLFHVGKRSSKNLQIFYLNTHHICKYIYLWGPGVEVVTAWQSVAAHWPTPGPSWLRPGWCPSSAWHHWRHVHSCVQPATHNTCAVFLYFCSPQATQSGQSGWNTYGWKKNFQDIQQKVGEPKALNGRVF